MAQTGFVYHEDYLKHNAGTWHPENSNRLENIVKHLERVGLLSKLIPIEPTVANLEWISTIHTTEYISHIESSCKTGVSHLDADTSISTDSYEVALLAVGGVLSAVDAVISQKINNAFCAVRPPGHHAEKNRAMGFCLFNNIAIAAKYIQKKHQLEKVLIIDWDVHHGNGTQNSFYDDPTVFYFSIHQWPYYPGSGHRLETGTGAGRGFTLNAPLSSGANDDDYIKIFKDELIPEAQKFAPDFILISAGFDAHINDPLANMNLTEDGYAKLTKIVKDLALDKCQGRIISLLEGGYNLEVLAKSVEYHIKALTEN
ncbi:MAG: histone deacetylase [bacterium]|nr:MAG: histone deacetylase [bacterium]